MKRDGIDFGEPPSAVIAYIHQLESKVGDLEVKVNDLKTELSDGRTNNALWLVAAGVAALGVSYWGLNPGWKWVLLAAALFVAGILHYREQR